MIEGTWKLIGGEQEGKPEPQEELERSKLVIEGDMHTVTIGDAVLKGTHTLDTTTDPMSIDATDTAGPFADMSLKGIFQLDGETLKICFAAPNEPRPADFTTQDGQATLMHIWKKQM